MAFTATPGDGQYSDANGIVYQYNQAKNTWTRVSTSANVITTDTANIISNTSSTSATTGALRVAGGAGIVGNLNVGGQIFVTGNILPTSNNLVNLGSPTNRFDKLYIAAQTIDLGGVTQITTDANGQMQFVTNSGNVTLSSNAVNFLQTVSNTGSGDSTPKIAAIIYPGNDTAADTAGGQTITLTGSNFAAGASVVINGVAVSVVTVVSSTQITFTSPALNAGSYILYLINSDGSTAISVPGIQYSGTPVWSTSAGSLGSLYETAAFNSTLTATGDAPVAYSLQSGTLPPGATLNVNGTISGSSVATASPTTYTFTIRATDAQNQDTDRQFSITVNPDVVTWSAPPSGNTYTTTSGAAISNVELSANSAAGYGITYTANTLPTGLSIVGANITGTPTVGGNVTTQLTATANVTSRTATRTINWVVTIAIEYWIFTSGLSTSAEAVRSLAVDSASNVIYLGKVRSSQAYVAKLSSGGVIQWQKTLGENYTSESVGTVIEPSIYSSGVVDSSGNFYHCGKTKLAGVSTRNAYVSRISSSGNLDWTNYLAFPYASNNDEFFTISQDTTGNIVVIGRGKEDQYTSRGVIAKYDSSGNLLWQKKVRNPYSYYFFDGVTNTGPYSDVYYLASGVDSADNIIIACGIAPNSSNTSQPIRGQLAKLDSSGTVIWKTKYNPPDTMGGGPIAFNITTDTSNHIYVNYGNTSASTLYGGLLVKHNASNGSILWQRNYYTSYSSDGPNYVRGKKVLFANGFVYLAGTSEFYGSSTSFPSSYPKSFGWIIKFNTSGTVQWQRRIKPSSWNTASPIDTVDIAWRDNNIYFTIPTPASQGSGYTYDESFLILKVPDDGSKTGSYTVGGLNFVYEAGGFTFETETSPGNSSLITSAGTSDIVVENSSYTTGTISPSVQNDSLTSSKTTIS